MGEITIERVYDYRRDPQRAGSVFLVDRLWPRGVSKRDAHVDLWLKDVAPTPDLRTWFDHREDRWSVFKERYASELSANPAFRTLVGLADCRDIALLYAAHDAVHNHVVVLADQLEKALQAPPSDQTGASDTKG